jgi:hypothetical protein
MLTGMHQNGMKTYKWYEDFWYEVSGNPSKATDSLF